MDSFVCSICKGQPFSNISNLRTHIKRFHPAKLNEMVPKKPFMFTAACNKCNKLFSTQSNMKLHVKRYHPDELDNLIKNKHYPYKCNVCPKQFSREKHFKAHKKNHNADIHRPNTLKCPLCLYEDVLKLKLVSHFEQEHDIFIVPEEIKFNTLEEFTFWKNHEEKTTMSSFINQHGSKNSLTGIKIIYVCHRSGNYIPQGSGMRHLKCQGTNKIGAFCPAAITVTIKDGSYFINYIKTHIGHDNDLGHLFLNNTEKLEIASKIAAKVPFSTILEEIQDSTSISNFNRLHLLTKKDLFNIKQTYNLNCISLHKIDAVSEKSTMTSEIEDSVHILGSNNNINSNNTNLKAEKEKLKNLFCSKVDGISSEKELIAIKKIVASVEQTLKAINCDAITLPLL